MASGTLVVFGADANSKALRSGEMILERVKRAGWTLEHTNIERLGGDESHEIVLRVSARDSRRAAVERFTKEYAPLVTSGPPGITGYTTGRPQVREVFAYWPTLVDKKGAFPQIEVLPELS
jgi:hypothetical protein